MEPAAAVIVENLQSDLSSACPALYREHLLFALAMACACAVFPLFIVWMLSRRDHRNAEKGVPCKVYIHQEPAMTQHFILAAALLITAMRKLYLTFRDRGAGGPWLTCLAVLLALLAVWAAYRLLKWRVSGICAAGGYIFCYAALEQYRCFRYVAQVIEMQKSWPVMVQYYQYISADYQVTWAMASSILALAALIFLSVYCYRRRFLFLPGRLDMPRCARCGQVINEEGGFCTNCGQPLHLESGPIRPAVVSLGQKEYCAKCGTRLFKGSCLVCDKDKGLADTLKKAGREAGGEAKGKLRRVIAMGLFIMFITIIPGQLSPLNRVLAGSGDVHNAFAERLIELGENPDLPSNAEWLAGFDSAADALYAVEARWTYVAPRSVPSGDLLALPAHSEASLLKMELLEQIREIVHTGRTAEAGGPAELLDALQYTAGLQLNAYQYRYVPTNSLGPLEKIEHGCLDGARAILWQVKTEWISGGVLAACALLCIWMLNTISIAGVTGLEQRVQSVRISADARRRRYAVGAPPAIASALGRAFAAGKGVWFGLLRVGNELWALAVQLLGAIALLLSLFRWRNLWNLFRWVRDGLTDGPCAHPAPSAAYQREQRIASAIAVGIVGCIFILVFVPSWISYSFLGSASQTDKPTYLAAAKAAASDYAGPIANAVSNMQTSGTVSEEDLQQMYDLLSAQAEADRVILDMDPSVLEDMEGLREFHAGLCSLCADDLAALERIMADLEAGQVPSPELLGNYTRLREENYLWVTEQLFEAYVVYTMEAVS